MFTGIVEESGRVEAIELSDSGARLTVSCEQVGDGTRNGDSVAVNGCCLTVIGMRRAKGKTRLRFDLLRETWRRTCFSSLRVGSLVNLERALLPSTRLGGHFVTGHIDGVGKVARWEKAGQDHLLDISAPAAVMRYVIHKGSIAVDGVSLTVAAVRKSGFRLWIIPHTLAVTCMGDYLKGSRVNLEADMLGKYVEKFVNARVRAE